MLAQGVIANVLRNRSGVFEYLYLRRSGGKFEGQWWPVAGTCTTDEPAIDALLRELKEETGLSPNKVFDLGLTIPHDDGKSTLLGYVVYVGPDDIVELNYEHDAYAWLSKDEVLNRLPETVHPLILYINDNFVAKAPSIEKLVWSAPQQDRGNHEV